MPWHAYRGMTDEDLAGMFAYIKTFKLNRTGFVGGSIQREDGPMGRQSKYSPELRERAVGMVFEHAPEYPSQWGAIRSVAEKIGGPVEVLRRWARQAERDAGQPERYRAGSREKL
jgi:hypothetical protein